MKKTLLIIVLTSLFIPLKSSYAIEVTASDGLTFTQSSSSYIFDGDRAGKLNFTSSTNTFSLTDFSEISGFSSSSTSHTFGIADSPTSGYDATINLIPGYGYNTKVDIRDEIGDLVLEDNELYKIDNLSVANKCTTTDIKNTFVYNSGVFYCND